MNEYAGPVLLMIVAGMLVGGAISLRKQQKVGASWGCAVAGLLAFCGGLYLIYG